MTVRGFAAIAALIGCMAAPMVDAAETAPATAPSGRELYYACSSCHGERGEGNEAFAAPALAGLDAAYLERQIGHFSSAIRGGHPEDTDGQQMTLLARTLRDAASITAVAAYVAGLPLPPRPTRTVSGDARRGARLYEACIACHGTRAQGNPDLAAPSLAQLPDWYVRAQLDAYRKGWRGYHPDDAFGQQMRAAAAALSGARDPADLAVHIRSLR